MSYLVIARKWRPLRFEDLAGQEHIARLLSNSIELGKVAHAYIFSGPRGVGKTSAARILARALNCEQGPTPTPCGSCKSCSSILTGSSVDVMEIDGASNTGIDNIRDLREQVKYAPSEGRYKVYIIDEVHMLSTQAFNGLLKTLEEPPPYVIFVLATTSPNKIPLTVHSRCQHLPFKRISTMKIKDRLKLISSAENIKISDTALDTLARAADGSMRDSLTILDQVASSLEDIKESDLKELLGISDFGSLLEISKAIIKGNRPRLLEIIGDITESGADLRAFTKDLAKFFRDIMITRIVGNPSAILDVSADQLDSIKKGFADSNADMLSIMLAELMKTEAEVRFAAYPRVTLEMSLVRISYLSSLKPVSDAISNLESLIDNMPVDSSITVSDSNAPSEDSKDMTHIPVEDDEIAELTSDIFEDAGDSTLRAEPAPSYVVQATSIDAPELLKKIMLKLNNAKFNAKLERATPLLENNILKLTFNSNDEAICVPEVTGKAESIGAIAAEFLNKPVSVVIEIVKKQSVSRHDIKKKVLSDPTVRQALELFEGKLVDVKSIDPNEIIENGG